MKRKFPMDDDHFQENFDKIMNLEKELADLKAHWIKSDSSDNDKKSSNNKSGQKKNFKKTIPIDHQKFISVPIKEETESEEENLNFLTIDKEKIKNVQIYEEDSRKYFYK
jgi:hypothetical protein